MTTIRKLISGLFDHLPRRFAIVTDAGDVWVLADCEPANDHVGNEVTVEGELVGLDRIRVDWLGVTPE